MYHEHIRQMKQNKNEKKKRKKKQTCITLTYVSNFYVPLKATIYFFPFYKITTKLHVILCITLFYKLSCNFTTCGQTNIQKNQMRKKLKFKTTNQNQDNKQSRHNLVALLDSDVH